MTSRVHKLALLLFALSPFALRAQMGVPKNYEELPPMYQHAFKLDAYQKGEHELEILLETFGAYSAYRDSIKIKADNFSFTLKEGTKASRAVDPLSKRLREFYKDQNTFVYAYSSPDNASLKEVLFQLQACSKENCLLPVWVKLPLHTTPTMSAAPAGEIDQSLQSGLASKFKAIFNSSNSILSLPSLLILFLAGLITAFSPCVLPLFPITLGIFSRWSHHDSRKATALSLSYGLGIILCYAVHGLISAATGGVFGSLTQSPFYLITIGGILFVSGLIYSGMLPFPFANFFLQIAGAVEGPQNPQKEESFKKLLCKGFLMGATLGLVASPCVGPILVSLLALLSRQLPQGNLDSYVAGFCALSIFGVGMALPFLVLGHFYFRLHKRVQMGRFSVWAKYVGSALLVGASFFFLIPGYQILHGKYGPKVAAAPMPFKKYSWESKPANTWLVADFRADWCAACVEIEHEVFMDASVQHALDDQKWALVSVDMTDPDQNAKLASKYEVISLPTVLFISPEGKVCKTLTLNEKEKPANFVRRLEKAKADCS